MSHLQISVTVESRLSGPASGFSVIHADPGSTVDSLIGAYLTEKGVKHGSNYVLRTAGDDVLDGVRTLTACRVSDGDTLYLTNRSSGDDMFGFNNWYIMALLAVIISITGLVAVSMVYSATGTIPRDYGVVFDAGSTHTTMTVYSWRGEKLNNTGEPKQNHMCTMSDGGIAMYVGREEKLQSALRSCLNVAKSSIPGGRVATTPLYLGATAGMRLLNIKNSTAASKILQTVDTTFSMSGFRYQSGMASIISGDTEAADAWITSNYVTKQLTKMSSEPKSISSLDLGGASTQFAVQKPENGTFNDTVDLSLYGVTHEVFVRSYLCFGVVQSFVRHTAQLTIGWNSTSLVIDPCLPSGFNVTIPLKAVFDSPCTAMNSTLKPKFDPSTNVTFIGSSSSANCSRQVRLLLNQTECKNYYQYQDCFIPENLADYDTPFMAISSFYYVMQFLNLTQPTLQDFFNVVKNVCEKPWPKARFLYKANVGGSQTQPQYYCYQGQYAYHLLTTGYNFTNATWNKIVFADSVNGTDLGWSMGFMINATNTVTAEVPAEPIALAVFVCLTLLFVVMLFLAFGFAFHAWRQKRETAPYQRLSQYGAI